MDVISITDCQHSWAPGVIYAWLAWNTQARQAPTTLKATVFHFWEDGSRQPRTFTPETPGHLWT